MKTKKRLLLMLVLLITAVTGAWAKIWTELQEGDVLKVGDQFHPTVNWGIHQRDYIANINNSVPWTLIRADLTFSSTLPKTVTVTEKPDGAYYVFKDKEGNYFFSSERNRLPVTNNSDGVEAKDVDTSEHTCDFVVHEATVPIPVKQPDGTWTFKMPAAHVQLEIDYYDPILTLAANPAAGGTVELADMVDNGYNVYVNGELKSTIYDFPFTGITASTFGKTASDDSDAWGFDNGNAIWKDGVLTINGPTDGTIYYYSGVDFQVACVKNRPTLPTGVSWYTVPGSETLAEVAQQGLKGDLFQWFGTYNFINHYIELSSYEQHFGLREDVTEGATITSVELTSTDNFDELSIVYPTTYTRTVSGNVLTISDLPEGTSEIGFKTESNNAEVHITGIKVDYESAPAEGKYYVKEKTKVNLKATAAPRYTLGSWTNATAGDDVTTASVTVGEEDVTVTANFTPNPVLTLAVNPEKSGSVVLADATIEEKATNIATKSEKRTYAADGVTVTVVDVGDPNNGAYVTSYSPMTISTDDGGNLTSLVLEIGNAQWNAGDLKTSGGTITVIENTNQVTITGINAPSVQITNDHMIYISSVEVNHMATVYPDGVLPALGAVSKTEAITSYNTYQNMYAGEFFITTGFYANYSGLTISRKDDAPEDVQMTSVELTIQDGSASDLTASVGTVTVNGNTVRIDVPANTSSVTISSTNGVVFDLIKVNYTVTAMLKNAYSVEPNTDNLPLRAVPAKRYHFAEWSGSSVVADPSDATLAYVNVGTDDVTVTANFAKDPVLTFTPTPDGSGTVVAVGEQEGVTPALDEASAIFPIDGDKPWGNEVAEWTGETTPDNKAVVYGYYGSPTIKLNAEKAGIASIEITSEGNLSALAFKPYGSTSISGNVLTVTDLPENTAELEVSMNENGFIEISQIKVNYDTEVENAFSVAPNTTANFQAVPGDIYHFKEWGEGATADTQDATKASVTMGTTAKTVAVNFALNPVLTLEADGNGTLAIQGNEVTIADALTDGSVIVANLKTSNDIDYGATFTNNNGTFTASNGLGYWQYSALHSDQSNTLMLYCSHGNGIYNATCAINIDEGTFSVTGGDYRGTLVSLTVNGTTLPVANNTIGTGSALPASIVEKDADAGEYYVRPNTDFTVEATAATGNYTKAWTVDDGSGTPVEEDANSFNATKDITMSDQALTVTATFAGCPVLTIASSNATTGKVRFDGDMDVAPITDEMAAAWDGIQDEYLSAGDLPGFVPVSEEEARAWTGAATMGANYLIFNIEGDEVYLIYYNQDGTVNEVQHYTMSLYSMAQTCGASKCFYTTTDLPDGIAEKNASKGEYYAIPGVTATVKATAEENYHVVNWTDPNNEYTSGITYSDYLIASTEKYPAKSQLTLTVGENNLVALANFALSGYELTVPGRKFVTLYSGEALTLTDADVKLCTITNVGETTATAFVLGSTAHKLTPLLLWNTEDADKTVFVSFAEQPDGEAQHAQEFKGTLEPKAFTADEMADDDVTFYICNGSKFVPVKNAGTIAANRCWLEVANVAFEARAITIVFYDEATGLSEELRVKSEEGLARRPEGESQSATANWFTLDGRKVAAPTKKGVYINNGRKVVVK